MTRKEIEAILTEFGWIETNSEISCASNNSVYMCWINAQNVEVFLGNYFVEIITQSHAYPYKDTCSTREEVIDFLMK